jgi:MFS family permease
LLLLSDVALMVVSLVLVGNALLEDPSVPLLFAAQAGATGAYAFQRPARNALTPRLVRDDQLTAAIAVEDVVFNFARVVGPALSGVLIASFGLATAYLIDVATFAASLIAIWLLPGIPVAADADRPGLRSILVGLRYVRRTPVLLGIFVVDTNAMIFGMPSALFPAFAEEVGGGAEIVGFLYAAPFAGAFAASLASGWVGHVRRQGVAVLVAAGLWGAAIAVFGAAQSIPLALAMLALAGAADFISAILRGTILIRATPDTMRGRLSGIELAQVAGMPQLGNLEAGVVASITNVRFSIVSGGLACVLGTIIAALALPALVRYDSRRPRE